MHTFTEEVLGARSRIRVLGLVKTCKETGSVLFSKVVLFVREEL